MNAKFTAGIAVFIFLLVISVACKSTASQQMDAVNALIKTADSVKIDLAAIDPVTVESLYKSSEADKNLIIKNLKTDTLELEFAKKLDALLIANKQLATLTEDRLSCGAANLAIQKRLLKLKSDIENNAGNRSEYADYLKKEAIELRKIRNHSTVLKSRFDGAELNITQFQPEIERYLYRFVPMIK